MSEKECREGSKGAQGWRGLTAEKEGGLSFCMESTFVNASAVREQT